MSNIHQWIIVIQIVLNSSGALFAGDDREHVHIKVHIPEVHQKHMHFRKVKNHHYHPKKVVKTQDMADAGMDMAPFAMISPGMMDPPQQVPIPMPIASFPMALPAMPDMPTYGMDNTLEASVMKKPNMNGMSHMMSEGMFTKFHGMKKPSEFLGARPAEDVPKYAMDDDIDDYTDDYDTKSAEAMIVDQRVAGSTYPYTMGMSGLMKPKWSTYGNVFESSMKPYTGGMKYASLTPDWLSATTEDDYSTYERYHSPTTMHIAKARPLTSSRMKFEQHSYDRDPYSEFRAVSKKKKSKSEKRNRTPSSGFRINY